MKDKRFNDDKLREIHRGEKFICLFSGGKDCGLAVAMALSQGGILCELIQCVNELTQEVSWHKQSRNLAIQQAKCMDVPIKIVDCGPYCNRSKFINILAEYANSGIKYVVCGDICYGDQAILEMAICQRAGLVPKMPLWNRDYNEIIELQKKHKIKSVVSYVEDEKELDILGKEYTEEMYKMLKDRNIDPLGEDGEFHPTLVDAENFKNELNIRLGNIQKRKDGIRVCINIEGE